MIHLDAFSELRLQRGIEHVCRLGGTRPVAELLRQIGTEHDCLDGILSILDAWRAGLTPDMVQATGGDRFPHRLTAVPR
jgi:hypothetical protein